MKKFALYICVCILTISCGIYSFNTGDVGNAKTIRIDRFPNVADLVEPTLSQKFTVALQDLFTRQSNLSLTNSQADLLLEGEITGYRIIPITATADQRAAQNRLTITVQVRYTNTLDEEKDFERSFSFFSDFDANAQLTGGVLDGAFEEIFERMTQDIFNAALSNW